MSVSAVDPIRNRFSEKACFLCAYTVMSLGVLATSYFSVGYGDILRQTHEKLETAAVLISDVLADGSGRPLNQSYDWVTANELLRRMAAGQTYRIQVFDRNGRMSGDSEIYDAEIEAEPLASSGIASVITSLLGMLDIVSWGRASRYEPYEDVPPTGISRHAEVYDALAGDLARSIRLTGENELILSVAAPIKRVKTVLGAVVASERGATIDRRIAELRRDRVVVTMIPVALGLLLVLWLCRPDGARGALRS